MEHSISISTTTRGVRLNEERLRDIAARVVEALGLRQVELSVTFVGETRMRTLNRDWRDKDRSTDVLSFPQMEWKTPLRVGSASRAKGPIVLGDIVISPVQAARNARHIGQDLDREVCFLMTHGILHLCGHDHMNPADERRMLREQSALMDALAKGSRGQPLWRDCLRRAGSGLKCRN